MRWCSVVAIVLCVASVLSTQASGEDVKKVRILVFDGLADWEIGLVSYELNTRNAILVETVGLSDGPIVTGGGLRVVPDIRIDAALPADSAMLILPGGEMWHSVTDQRIEELVRSHKDADVPVAAICAATSYLARLGVFDAGISHTSNALEYLEQVVPDYKADAHYVEAHAVSDGGIITAGGEASREFAYEILKALGVYDEEVLAEFAEFWGCRLSAPPN